MHKLNIWNNWQTEVFSKKHFGLDILWRSTILHRSNLFYLKLKIAQVFLNMLGMNFI
jgi:hypothetical protein